MNIQKALLRIKHANNLINYGMNVKSMVGDLRGFYVDKFEYSAVLDTDAYIYDDVLKWLNDMVKSRRIAFNSTSRGVERFYDGANQAKFWLDGHKITCWVQTPEVPNFMQFDPDVQMGHGASGKNLTFTCKNAEGLAALEQKFQEMTEKKALRPDQPRYYNVGKWGWDAIAVAPRKLESVFLPGHMKDDFLSDLDRFFANEERFIRMGLPWSRGYMFYGPPGNGKSSIVKAIVHDYNLSLYNLQLSSVPDDMTLGALFGNLSKRSVLLIEDIDIFTGAISREESDKGPTLAGLLNCLDGINTPHGLITIMTTNRHDSLDEALIRAGRIDRKMELTAPDEKQVRDMFYYIYEEPLGVKPGRFKNMAEFVEIFKKNPNDAEAARIGIRESVVPDLSQL